jgi:hypothetical protein
VTWLGERLCGGKAEATCGPGLRRLVATVANCSAVAGLGAVGVGRSG